MESLTSSADVYRGFLESDVNQVCSNTFCLLRAFMEIIGGDVVQKPRIYMERINNNAKA